MKIEHEPRTLAVNEEAKMKRHNRVTHISSGRWSIKRFSYHPTTERSDLYTLHLDGSRTGTGVGLYGLKMLVNELRALRFAGVL